MRIGECLPGPAMPALRLLALVLAQCLVLAGSPPARAQSAQPAPVSGSAEEQDRVARALRAGGVVALIRHSATVPGVGDPPGFRLDQCPTQRNLSDAGRAQAGRIGQWFRQHEIEPTAVRASPWCRTRETARLAFGSAEDWSALSNLLRDRSRQDEHAKQVRDAIASVEPKELMVLVSHGVTIDAFIGEYLQQGEMVVVRPAARRARNDAVAGSEPGDGGKSREHGDGGKSREIEVVGRLLVP